MAWIITNWDVLLMVASGVVTAASLIAKLTPTEVDDKWVARLLKIIDVLALNNKPTEIRKT